MDISILGWLFIAIFLSGGVGWIIGRENMIDEIEIRDRKIQSLYSALEECEKQRDELIEQLKGKHYD